MPKYWNHRKQIQEALGFRVAAVRGFQVAVDFHHREGNLACSVFQFLTLIEGAISSLWVCNCGLIHLISLNVLACVNYTNTCQQQFCHFGCLFFFFFPKHFRFPGQSLTPDCSAFSHPLWQDPALSRQNGLREDPAAPRVACDRGRGSDASFSTCKATVFPWPPIATSNEAAEVSSDLSVGDGLAMWG